MQTGTKISLLGHGALVTWALFGGMFQAEPLPFEMPEVSMISAEEFDQLLAQDSAPEAPEVAETPQGLTPPEAAQQPEVRPPEAQPPAQAEQPSPPPVPDRAEPEIEQPTPVPPADPEPAVAAIQPPPEQPALELPDAIPSLTPPQAGQQADRVAPEAIAPPPPDTAIDDIARDTVAPEPGVEENTPAQEATAQEAASERLVTEAEADESLETAVLSTPRPRLRPEQPLEQTPEQSPAPTPEPEPETVDALPEAGPEAEPEAESAVEPSALEAALAEALAAQDLSAPAAPEAPVGPPLTASEREGLRVAVSQCWNLGALSSEALRTTVVVSVSLNREGKPDIASLEMVSATGGSGAAANQAYEAARRAVIRCGSKGFDLPADKYEQWREIEMTFNPEGMRIR